MGGIPSSHRSYPTHSSDVSKAQYVRSKTFKTCKKIANMQLDDIVGVAVQIESTIIFLSQNRICYILLICGYMRRIEKKLLIIIPNDIKTEIKKFYHDKEDHLSLNLRSANTAYIKLNKYNLETKHLSEPIRIDTEQYMIDLENSVYCMDKENNNLIYLINKNEQILTISTEKNQPMIQLLTYIDAGNKVTDQPKDCQNIATLTMHNNKLIIFGAIAVNNDNNDNNDNIQYIPYDLIKKRNHKEVLAIYKFGRKASVEYIPENGCFILMGGDTRYRKTDLFVPTYMIWQCQLLKDLQYEWSELPLYLPEAMHSFGIMHLDLDTIRYIILFGGTHVNIMKEEEESTNLIYALYLDKKLQKLTEYEKDKKQHQYHGWWFNLNYVLPIKANYHVFYDQNIDKDTIHLIAYNDGIHFTILYKELMDILQTDRLLTENGKAGTCHKCCSWTTGECQGPVIPTKIKKLKGRGPKAKKKRISDKRDKNDNVENTDITS